MAQQPINLNTADAAQLTRIEGIDGERARLILEYRRAHGPFHSWEEVRNVPGIGEALSERVTESATLGQAGEGAETGPTSAARGGPTFEETASGEEEQGEEERDEDVEADLEEIEALMSIAQLDMEAAAAYEVASEDADDEPLRQMLHRFRDDHRRHVEDLIGFARRRDRTVDVPAPDVDRSVLVGLVSSASALDATAAVEALVANEQLTNATYQTALWLVSDEEALTIVRRNREDERRHLEALAEYASRSADGGV